MLYFTCHIFFFLHSNCVTQIQAKFCAKVSPCNSVQLNLMDQSAILKVMNNSLWHSCPIQNHSISIYLNLLLDRPFKRFSDDVCLIGVIAVNNKSDMEAQRLTQWSLNEQPMTYTLLKQRKLKYNSGFQDDTVTLKYRKVQVIPRYHQCTSYSQSFLPNHLQK